MLINFVQPALLRQRGATLAELMIAVVIVGILVSVAAPNLKTWVQSSQIRTASESIISGVQLARMTAVTRNSTAQFSLCGTDSTWSVMASSSVTASATACGATTNGWELIQTRIGKEGSPNVAVSAVQSTISFNGLGQISPIPANNIQIDVTNPTAGTCVSSGGTIRCMRVVVSTGGQVRLCNPAFTQTTNPQGC